MRELPILFSAQNIPPLLDDTKTQTRRVVKPQKGGNVIGLGGPGVAMIDMGVSDGRMNVTTLCCPYGQPGDRLWVREAHSIFATHGQNRSDGKRWGPWDGLPTVVSPDGKQIAYFREGFDRCDPGRWRPSIHMPRWASRITLEITAVRLERLQDISEADALAEGIDAKEANRTLSHIGMNVISGPVAEYSALWESINGYGSWDLNQMVWVIEFKRVLP